MSITIPTRSVVATSAALVLSGCGGTPSFFGSPSDGTRTERFVPSTHEYVVMETPVQAPAQTTNGGKLSTVPSDPVVVNPYPVAIVTSSCTYVAGANGYTASLDQYTNGEFEARYPNFDRAGESSNEDINADCTPCPSEARADRSAALAALLRSGFAGTVNMPTARDCSTNDGPDPVTSDPDPVTPDPDPVTPDPDPVDQAEGDCLCEEEDAGSDLVGEEVAVNDADADGTGNDLPSADDNGASGPTNEPVADTATDEHSDAEVAEEAPAEAPTETPAETQTPAPGGDLRGESVTTGFNTYAPSEPAVIQVAGVTYTTAPAARVFQPA